MVAPDFFSDEELIEQLDAGGRLFYLGMWCAAEDSGVVLLSALNLKMKIFPGGEVSAEQITAFIDKLIELGKIIPFEANGKRYGWLRNFHRHQKLEKPCSPVLPLPSWVMWTSSQNRRERKYSVDESAFGRTVSGHDTDVVRTAPGPVPLNRKEEKGKEEKELPTALVQDLSGTKLPKELQQALITLSALQTLLVHEVTWISKLSERYPRVDIACSALNFKTWVTENQDRFKGKSIDYQARFEKWVMEDDQKKKWRIVAVPPVISEADREEEERIREVVTSTNERLFG